MRVSEIYLAKVLDRDGVMVGRVDDLRFSLAAARPGDSFAAIAADAELWPFGKVGDRFGGPVTYKLTGFVCSTGWALGHRLGYGQSAAPGPWLVQALVRMVRRRSAIVEWSDVDHVDRDGVHIRLSSAEVGMSSR